jgi:hypothetical protein
MSTLVCYEHGRVVLSEVLQTSGHALPTTRDGSTYHEGNQNLVLSG